MIVRGRELHLHPRRGGFAAHGARSVAYESTAPRPPRVREHQFRLAPLVRPRDLLEQRASRRCESLAPPMSSTHRRTGFPSRSPIPVLARRRRRAARATRSPPPLPPRSCGTRPRGSRTQRHSPSLTPGGGRSTSTLTPGRASTRPVTASSSDAASGASSSRSGRHRVSRTETYAPSAPTPAVARRSAGWLGGARPRQAPTAPSAAPQ
jgi:hypothetical protein